ncbi:hypothetical protein ACIBKY_25005 [Nonomuraea sp. NPDC050394]|uniref:hypothetical protein n=1 Tax=Nonomuraea sp. NPDC050394 TaxID=3364363 RepID=UPI0037933959
MNDPIETSIDIPDVDRLIVQLEAQFATVTNEKPEEPWTSNDCTYACTNGCTGGCTKSCLA